MISSIYKIRFSDCDPMGHLNNARYIDYMFNAMEDAVKNSLRIDLAKQMKKGFGWVVQGHDIKYFNPALHHEKVKIITEVADVKEDQILFFIKMYNKKGNKLKSILRSRMIHYDIKNKCRTAHSAKVQRKFESMLNRPVKEHTLKRNRKELAS